MNEPLNPDVAEGFIRLRGNMSYDGTNFSGWGTQIGQRTVQGDLEDALAQILRSERLPITCAGRTDAGVHAVAQVFHVDVPKAGLPTMADLLYKLNAILENDLVVTSIEFAPDGFEARFSALSRTYVYYINDGLRNPQTRRHVYNHGWALDVPRMQQSSIPLLGLHDFTSFCKQKDFGTAIRELKVFDWVRQDDGVIRVDVTADAFCYSMVRGLVGCIMDVGAFRRPVDWPAEYLVARKREPSAFVAPARGLTLIRVDYPDDSELRSRIAQTKRNRLRELSDG